MNENLEYTVKISLEMNCLTDFGICDQKGDPEGFT